MLIYTQNVSTTKEQDCVGTQTYNAIYPWVPVEIPNRLRSDSIPQQLVDLRAVPEVLEDLLRDGAGQPLLVVRVLYERDPSGHSERPKDNQRRPSALPNRKCDPSSKSSADSSHDGRKGEGMGGFTSTTGSSRFGAGLA